MAYARDEAERERLLASGLGGKGKIETSRFKGLGEMSAAQLKETTMDPTRRQLTRVAIDDLEATGDLLERLMGRRAETRFDYIQQNARFAESLDV